MSRCNALDTKMTRYSPGSRILINLTPAYVRSEGLELFVKVVHDVCNCRFNSWIYKRQIVKLVKKNVDLILSFSNAKTTYRYRNFSPTWSEILFLLYFLLVLRTFNETRVNISLRFRMWPLCVDEEQLVTAANWKIACLLTMALLLVLLLIFITLYVSGQRLCGAQKGKTYDWRRMFMCSYGEGRLEKKRWRPLSITFCRG